MNLNIETTVNSCNKYKVFIVDTTCVCMCVCVSGVWYK